MRQDEEEMRRQARLIATWGPNVYVSVLGTGAGTVLAQLEAHRVPLQTQLARHVVLKYTPHLIFHLDDSIERGTRVIEILQKIETPRTESA